MANASSPFGLRTSAVGSLRSAAPSPLLLFALRSFGDDARAFAFALSATACAGLIVHDVATASQPGLQSCADAEELGGSAT